MHVWVGQNFSLQSAYRYTCHMYRNTNTNTNAKYDFRSKQNTEAIIVQQLPLHAYGKQSFFDIYMGLSWFSSKTTKKIYGKLWQRISVWLHNDFCLVWLSLHLLVVEAAFPSLLGWRRGAALGLEVVQTLAGYRVEGVPDAFGVSWRAPGSLGALSEWQEESTLQNGHSYKNYIKWLTLDYENMYIVQGNLTTCHWLYWLCKYINDFERVSYTVCLKFYHNSLTKCVQCFIITLQSHWTPDVVNSFCSMHPKLTVY